MLRPLVRGKTKRMRKGKGFSLGELKRVGLNIKEAKKLGIAVDKRRRSTRDENIKLLKEFLSKVKG